MTGMLGHAREHGGPDAAGVPRHDFSSNANACGPCPLTLAALQQADAAHYPDPHYTDLRAALARFHGVAVERVALAASGSEFIQRITAAVLRCGGRTVNLPTQAYGDYAQAAQAWQLDAAEADRATLVWCCDPSSPLGQSQQGLAARVDALADGAVGVLDLAYEPLRLQGRLGLTAAQRNRLWQLWTPNKALGLTGVRAAYAIAPAHPAADAEVLKAVQALAPSWPLGAHGVALLQSWVAPTTQAWLAGSRDILRAWKLRQIALCEYVLGWACEPSEANFFCARPAAAEVPTLVARLRRHGIKLRDTASFGLPGRVRLAALPPAAQDALHAAMNSRNVS